MHINDEPLLSVVVAIVSDTTEARGKATFLEKCLESLAQQNSPPPMEILVPYRPPVDGLEEVEKRFPRVHFLRVESLADGNGMGGSREHHDAIRAQGLRLARGKIIGLLEDVARPDANWSARIVEAHQQAYGAIGGAIENGVHRLLNWAVYFCDFGKYQNPIRAGDSTFASDANVSYKRAALDAVRHIWENSYDELSIHRELISRGHKLALSPEIVVYQYRVNLRLSDAVKERFVWGRSYAAIRSRHVGNAWRVSLAVLSPALPAILLWRMMKNAVQKRRCTGPFFRAIPLTVVLLVSWSCGEFIGYCTRRASGNVKRTAGIVSVGAGAKTLRD